jgi:alpha-beta hydrolase superfamily lysophospholipase
MRGARAAWIEERRFALARPDDVKVAAYRWTVSRPPRAIVVVAHGMGEHARRYPPALVMLLESGIDLYGIDHRGHGTTLALSGRAPGDFGPGGFSAVVDDLASLVNRAKLENPGLPLLLLGHSMGSFISQAYALDHSVLIDGLVLAGTSAVDAIAEAAQRESNLAVALNRAFKPARTSFDWLSSNEAEVDAYIADPLCGFSLTPESMISLLSHGTRLADSDALAAIRKELPLYILAGECDPLVSDIGNLDRLIERYRAAGLRPALARYPQGRHEILNETNRSEVVQNLLNWLNQVIDQDGKGPMRRA